MAQDIHIRGLSKAFGATQVLQEINLHVQQGEFVSLLGPSGCGKSTLLRIIAGLERQDQGTIHLGERAAHDLAPHERNVAMVFQNYALYPHMSVAQNIAMPLVMSRLGFLQRQPFIGALWPSRRVVQDGIRADVRALAASLGLSQLLDRKPGQLSGGQRQRVALARAMVRDPAAFLMDEPLSNLDAKLRVGVREELAELHRRLGATFLYVTHDQAEAMTLSDRVAVMDRGRILQVATPRDLYDSPNSVRVARFVGHPEINLMPITIDGQGVGHLGRCTFRMIATWGRFEPGVHQLGMRAEHVRCLRGEGDTDCDAIFPARLERVEDHGHERLCAWRSTEIPDLRLTCRSESGAVGGPLRVGDEGMLGMQLAKAHVFDGQGERLACTLVALRRGRLSLAAAAP